MSEYIKTTAESQYKLLTVYYLSLKAAKGQDGSITSQGFHCSFDLFDITL